MSEDLEERLVRLREEYQQPVSRFNYWLVSGLVGAALFGILVGSQLLGPRPAPVTIPTYTPAPTLEVITMEETPTTSLTIAITPTPSPEPTYAPTETSIPTPEPTYTPPPTFTPTPTNTSVPPTSTNIPTATLTPKPLTYIPVKEEIWPADGGVMVFVPEGEFIMGTNEVQSKSHLDSRPAHKVYLNAYLIDKTEVTNQQYKKFLDASPNYPIPTYWDNNTRVFPAERGNHPVVYVSWQDAMAYCQWAGKRLPTEAEWEKAASWDWQTNQKYTWPWGNVWDDRKANTYFGPQTTTPVGSYPRGASPYGVLDMAGNVWEWVADWYDANYYSNSPYQNPLGPDSGLHHILRGGSWYNLNDSAWTHNRKYYGPTLRTVPNHEYIIGFRCARSE